VFNRYNHPTLAWMLDYWPATILLPSVLLLIAVLALITRSWDQRDQGAAHERMLAATSSRTRPAAQDTEAA